MADEQGEGASASLFPAQREQGGTDALPCLFSDNCDKDGRKLTGEQRKTAHALAANVKHLVETYGLENCGFFTVTFDPADLRKEAEKRCLTLWQESQRRIHNFARRILKSLFKEYIRVLEFHKNGSPHYHLLVVCQGDISTGFNWDHYEAVRDWSRSGRKGPKPQGNLNRTDLLAEIHHELNWTGPSYGIGWMELTPIRTNAEAVGRYVGGYLQKGMGGKTEEHKGARTVCYSQTFQRLYKGRFAWVDGGREWREKLAAWAGRHACGDLSDVRAIFGPRWAYHHREAIAKTELTNDNSEIHSQRGERPDLGGGERRGENDHDQHHGSGSGTNAVDVHPPAGSSGSEDGSKSSVRRYQLNRPDLAAAGKRIASRAAKLAPSLIEDLYPEFARIQREREQ